MNKQVQYYENGNTRDTLWRQNKLLKLRYALKKHEKELYEAFKEDLNKPKFEVYTTEIALIYQEIKTMIANLPVWAAKKWAPQPFVFKRYRAYVTPIPKGRVLIIAPFNYPLQLSLVPLIGAIASGNVVTLKLSEYTPHINKIIIKMLNSIYKEAFVTCIEGGVAETERLLAEPFDHIFFTGSSDVGKIVMGAAAQHLTPVTLELGGKSPAIVDGTMAIDTAAKKLAWGKFLNNGQTCVAPDTIYVKDTHQEAFIEAFIKAIQTMYGNDAQASEDYGRVVSAKHANRLKRILDVHANAIVYGGHTEGCYIEPTVLKDCEIETEIFGPICPIIAYKNTEDLLKKLKKHQNPLALYIFSKQKAFIQTVHTSIAAGDVMINDVIMHTALKNLPFGGLRQSGIGSYHGKYSFETFSHYQSYVKSPSRIRKIMVAPYTKWYHRIPIIRKFF